MVFVPKGERKNAKKLIQEFDKRPNELTWSSDGIIFIDQVGIPGSHMYTLFPLLFKKTKPSNMVGLPDLLQKIKDMGLSAFLNHDEQQKGKGVEKNSKRPKLEEQFSASDAWWYIGP